MNPRPPQGRATLEQRFESVLIQATRALAGERGLKVSCAAPGASAPAGTLLLPPIPAPLTAGNVAWGGGGADRLALRRAYFDESVHARFRPAGSRARELYDVLEDMRCQSLGALAMTGVAHNLEAALIDELERNGALGAHLARSSGKVHALALLFRERLTGMAPPAASAALMSRWQSEIEARTGAHLAQLTSAAHDQTRFALLLHALVRDLDLGSEIRSRAQRQQQAAAAAQRSRDTASAPAPDSDGGLRVKRQQGDLEQDESSIAPKPPVELPSSQGQEAQPGTEQKDNGERLARTPLHDDSDNPNRHYHIFTRAHDEVVDAASLCDRAELERLRAQLNLEARNLQGAVARLAHRLERLLRAQQLRRWHFDLEEGVLDAARLTRVIVELLKENIDGEALLWAHERLMRRAEARRLLMVISDGVPLDEATLSANPGRYLDQHLRNVVRWIERRSEVELLAIGIGHEVGDFYRRAVTIASVEELGPTMLEQLACLFAGAVAPAERSRGGRRLPAGASAAGP